MNKVIGTLAALILSVVWAGTAQAEAEAGQVYFSMMASYIDDDKDRGVNDGVNGGQISLGYAFDDYWNIEGLISAAAPESGHPSRPNQEHTGIGVDVQRVFYRASKFSPYLHAGLGYFDTKITNAPGIAGGMYSAGVGFYLDFTDNTNLALRGEWRYRVDEAGRDAMRDHIFSVGLHLPFGSRAPAFSDLDGDGVGDSMDRCPNTPAGATVDAYGCEVDSDGDGVSDSKDRCPGTPAGTKVDRNGCAQDSDGDGVSDGDDKCPGTPAGAAVDATGCELDGDNDGVVDRLDECPDSAAGVQVDIKGCEIKAEIKLQGVNFESNSDRLLPGATSVLNDAAATLRKNPSIKVEVAGHTDSDGAAAYNESLSARRAQTVYDFLASNGVAESRMTVRGYGESQPIADNSTATGKAENRRVVLRITER